MQHEQVDGGVGVGGGIVIPGSWKTFGAVPPLAGLDKAACWTGTAHRHGRSFQLVVRGPFRLNRENGYPVDQRQSRKPSNRQRLHWRTPHSTAELLHDRRQLIRPVGIDDLA